jgi:diguanylate cyclase (GGDEF)-like protein/PAS domain S-box-containing protein
MPLQVLLVEDKPGDVRLTQEAFRNAKMSVRLHVVSDGVEAMAFLRHEGAHVDAPRPDLILLDLNLPKMDSRAVLADIKGDDSLKMIPTIVLTTSEADEDIAKGDPLHANCYLSKPAEVGAFEDLMKSINDLWLRMVRLPQQSHTERPSKKPIKTLLLIEDDDGDARLLLEMFNEQGLHNTELMHVRCMREAEAHLEEHAVDIILLDLGLADAQGLATVQRAHAAAPRVPLVVVTGLDDESMAIQALQEGAQDYLVKGQIEARGLLRALRHAVERNIMEEALFVEKERAQVTLNCIGDAVACTDSLGNVSFLNAAAEKMIGWSWQETAGRPMSEILHIMDAAGHKTIPNPMAVGAGQSRCLPLPSNCLLIRRDGFEISIEASVAPIHDRKGEATGAVIIFRDVSAARAMALQMAHSARHDFLTGLPNRMLLKDRVSQAISLAQRHTKSVAILFLDLDGFKRINDSLGHSIGDKLLQSVAKRLVNCVRGADTVSRQGGDEFVVLLSEVERPGDTAITARKMLQAVAEAHSVEQQDLHVTTSIGVSVFPDDGLDAETLIKNADTAMYQAKENGRRGYQFFKPAMNVRAVERQFIEEGLRCALDRQEFVLHYQPKINLKTGVISGVEALIRWTHPIRGPLTPAQFIPIAEECGLILPIGNWVLREACRQARAWVDAGLPLTSIAVNISAMEFRDAGFLQGVFAVLTDTGLDPSFLELELTEGVLMNRVEATAPILKTLKERRVHLAVDDFGTGYSSLSHLRKFPVDALKIDQSFIRQIITAPEEAVLVNAMVRMGRSLKLRVVAEGVETQEELAFLQAHQCNEAQGYYFSQPVPSQQLTRLLETGLSEILLLRLNRTESNQERQHALNQDDGG